MEKFIAVQLLTNKVLILWAYNLSYVVYYEAGRAVKIP